jgi:hypothetical protein
VFEGKFVRLHGDGAWAQEAKSFLSNPVLRLRAVGTSGRELRP